MKIKALLMAFLSIFTFSIAYEEGFFIGKDAPDFTMLDESCPYLPSEIYYKKDGKWVKRCKEVKFSDILKKAKKEGKPVLVIFWAVGDRPGTYYFLPEMNKLYDKYKDKVIFMAVLLSRSSGKEVQAAKKELPLKIPVYRAYSDAIRNYKIAKVDVPYLVFITPDGKIQRILLRPASVYKEMEDKKGIHMREDRTIDEKHRFKIRYDIIANSIKEIDSYLKKLINE